VLSPRWFAGWAILGRGGYSECATAALRLCTFSAEKLKLGAMANRTGRTIATACGGAAVLALALGGVGFGGADVPYTNADPSSTEVVPTPASPDDECCDASQQPQAQGGGWDCKIALTVGAFAPARLRPRPALRLFRSNRHYGGIRGCSECARPVRR
jgi:hypothetical protein